MMLTSEFHEFPGSSSTPTLQSQQEIMRRGLGRFGPYITMASQINYPLGWSRIHLCRPATRSVCQNIKLIEFFEGHLHGRGKVCSVDRLSFFKGNLPLATNALCAQIAAISFLSLGASGLCLLQDVDPRDTNKNLRQ